MGFPQHRQCRILLVDDHADTRDLLERLLSRRFEVITAACYDSALASAEERTPDIVITDVGLPGGARRRRADARAATPARRRGHRRHRPFDREHHKFREAGFVSWLRKPIHLADLMDALTAVQLEPCTDADDRQQRGAAAATSTAGPARSTT